jgi:hypothetical protein
MPTTLTGLVLFLVLLVPGFAFVGSFRRFRPSQRRSTFAETAEVAVASAFALTAAGAVFGVMRSVWPDSTPDIGKLISEGRKYFEQEYLLVGGWACGLFAAATIGAWAAGRALGLKKTADPASMSSWWMLFEHYADGRDVTVTCILDDGSWIRGELSSYNNSAEDKGDRDIILVAPIEYALPDERLNSYGAGAISVAASRMIAMFVNYAEHGPSSVPTSSVPAAASVEGENSEEPSVLASAPSTAVSGRDHPS